MERGTHNLACYNNEDFVKEIRFDGDLTGGVLSGSLKDRKTKEVVADFVFAIHYDEPTAKTIVIAVIAHEVLAEIPCDKYNYDIKWDETYEQDYIGGEFLLKEGVTE